ncbi:MAG: hypothetical protein WAK17_03910 [Candidatus Nitrosopolaris sp.]|jgi:hypothetical protein
MDSSKCTITLIACSKYVPPIGLGITPLLVTLASPVHAEGILLRAQALQSVPTLGDYHHWLMY